MPGRDRPFRKASQDELSRFSEAGEPRVPKISKLTRLPARELDYPWNRPHGMRERELISRIRPRRHRARPRAGANQRIFGGFV